MNKNGVRPSQIAVMIAFALSCVLLLLFLWSSFGGPVPLRAKPYQVTVDFRQGAQLASYADVRISGVTVGKASRIVRNGKTVKATLSIEAKYAPLPADTRATLRSKTVVGETFIALSYGTRAGRSIPDGGRLASSNVQDAVELDGVLDVFDPKTRPRFKRLVASFSKTLKGRGVDLNEDLGGLAPTLDAADPVLRVLDRQSEAVRSGVRDLGTTFGAIGQQTAATRQLLRSGRRVVASTASVDDALRATVRQLPSTLRQATTTLDTARLTADEADPAIRALMPVAPLVKPALRNLDALAPDLRASLKRLTPTLKLINTGLPALSDVFDSVDPFVDRLQPVTDDALPMLRYLDLYKRELGISFANTAAATQATGDSIDGKTRHFVRLSPPINSETISGLTRRPPTSRINAYPLPGGYDDLGKGGMKSADCSNTSNPLVAFSIFDLGAPPCITQGPLLFDGRSSLFPDIKPESESTGATRRR